MVAVGRYAGDGVSAVVLVPREPTEEMVTAAEMLMPQLGRVQIRFLYQAMVAAAPGLDKMVGQEKPQ